MKSKMLVKLNLLPGEDGLKFAMRDLILRSGVCPETSCHLMHEMFRDEMEIPVNAVYAQFMDT